LVILLSVTYLSVALAYQRYGARRLAKEHIVGRATEKVSESKSTQKKQEENKQSVNK